MRLKKGLKFGGGRRVCSEVGSGYGGSVSSEGGGSWASSSGAGYESKYSAGGDRGEWDVCCVLGEGVAWDVLGAIKGFGFDDMVVVVGGR